MDIGFQPLPRLCENFDNLDPLATGMLTGRDLTTVRAASLSSQPVLRAARPTWTFDRDLTIQVVLVASREFGQTARICLMRRVRVSQSSRDNRFPTLLEYLLFHGQSLGLVKEPGIKRCC